MLGDLPVPTTLEVMGDLSLFLGRMLIQGFLQLHCVCFQKVVGVAGEETLPPGATGSESKV